MGRTQRRHMRRGVVVGEVDDRIGLRQNRSQIIPGIQPGNDLQFRMIFGTRQQCLTHPPLGTIDDDARHGSDITAKPYGEQESRWLNHTVHPEGVGAAYGGQGCPSVVQCGRLMSNPGAPLKPIPTSLRWAGRVLGWATILSWVAIQIPIEVETAAPAGWLLAFFTWVIALETHRWLPTQNTVAAAGLISAVGFLLAISQGNRSRADLALNVLIGFSHILSSRGLIRYLLRPWRGQAGYGAGVLLGTTLISAVSISLTQTTVGRPPSLLACMIQIAGTGLALLSASVWLLVKKPIPEAPNPWPAGFWFALTLTQIFALMVTGRWGVAAVAVSVTLVALVGICVRHRARKHPHQ
jgi:hypothetical protein